MVPTEAQEGLTFVAYLRVRGYKFTHIANETGSSPEARRRAVRVKQQGVSKGFPDYIVLVGSQTIAVELKRIKGSAISPEQKEWVAALNDAGTPTRICKGAGAAIEFIEEIQSNKLKGEKR